MQNVEVIASRFLLNATIFDLILKSANVLQGYLSR